LTGAWGLQAGGDACAMVSGGWLAGIGRSKRRKQPHAQ